ncbi:hypothetical protein SAE01_12620 [Segetibacter aerophilus]|uniref:DUF4760 domain-containing protein n=2 Tax=Segetibacter aerophilus TaxID=670293 RepID=A0A512B9W9_9BACT|nr:hypothetical protein SAE01_12620 [Segetibacter aerophilus]
MVTVRELLTTFWTQTAFVLTGIFALIFYLIKRQYDLGSKKAEIRFNAFFEKKILSLMSFQEAYAKFSDVFANGLPLFYTQDLSDLEKEKELITKLTMEIYAAHVIFSSKYQQLKLFLREGEREKYRPIMKNFQRLSQELVFYLKSDEAKKEPAKGFDRISNSYVSDFKTGADALRDIIVEFQKEVGY